MCVYKNMCGACGNLVYDYVDIPTKISMLFPLPAVSIRADSYTYIYNIFGCYPQVINSPIFLNLAGFNMLIILDMINDCI